MVNLNAFFVILDILKCQREAPESWRFFQLKFLCKRSFINIKKGTFLSESSFSSQRRIIRDFIHSCLLCGLFVLIWVIGSQWYFWPFWIFVGIVTAFFVRACSSGLIVWGKNLQNRLSSLLGELELKQINYVERALAKYLQTEKKTLKSEKNSATPQRKDKKPNKPRQTRKKLTKKNL